MGLDRACIAVYRPVYRIWPMYRVYRLHTVYGLCTGYVQGYTLCRPVYGLVHRLYRPGYGVYRLYTVHGPVPLYLAYISVYGPT